MGGIDEGDRLHSTSVVLQQYQQIKLIEPRYSVAQCAKCEYPNSIPNLQTQTYIGRS